MSNAIVPVVPKRNATTGDSYPMSLALGELAVNTTTGNVYLGADPGVVRIGVPVAAGTVLNIGTGDGSTVAYTVTGGTGTDAGGYLVSVGGIDQPNGWTVAGTTLTFSEAPPVGATVSVRAILKGEGVPTGGVVTFNTQGTHYWRVPAYVRYARVQAAAGDGSAGTNGQGTNGQDGGDRANGAPDIGANGTNGNGVAGTAGRSITFDGTTVAGGAAGQAGSIGYGGGGGGSIDTRNYEPWGLPDPYPGAAGNGPCGGQPGSQLYNDGSRNSFGGEGACGGANGQDGYLGGNGGAGADGGGNGGNCGSVGNPYGAGGGGGGGGNGGGGGGGGADMNPGKGGQGGTGSGATAGGTGETLDTAYLFTGGALVPITISAGAGTASITITY